MFHRCDWKIVFNESNGSKYDGDVIVYESMTMTMIEMTKILYVSLFYSLETYKTHQKGRHITYISFCSYH